MKTNIKFYTSYFYQIRNFKPWMIPISTAMWDPRWFHQFKTDNFTFQDKNGVVNGLRYTPFAPGSNCENLCRGIDQCKNLNGDEVNPTKCKFLKEYCKQLNNLDINNCIQDIIKIIKNSRFVNLQEIKDKETGIINYTVGGHDLEIVLIVFEVPANPCSERSSLIKWFNENGIEMKELEYPIK